MDNFTVILIIYLVVVFILYTIGMMKRSSTLKGLAIVLTFLLVLESIAYYNYGTFKNIQEDSIDTDYDLLYDNI